MNNEKITPKTIKFEDIKTPQDAIQYATEWSLPKVPFTRMYKFNCTDERKCVKLTIALQSVFNNAKEINQFKITDLVKIEEDFYLAETSVGNFELKFRAKEDNVSVEKTERKIIKEKVVEKIEKIEPQEVVDASAQQIVEEKVQPQEVKEIDKIEKKKGFSLRLFGKEILGWN